MVPRWRNPVCPLGTLPSALAAGSADWWLDKGKSTSSVPVRIWRIVFVFLLRLPAVNLPSIRISPAPRPGGCQGDGLLSLSLSTSPWDLFPVIFNELLLFFSGPPKNQWFEMKRGIILAVLLFDNLPLPPPWGIETGRDESGWPLPLNGSRKHFWDQQTSRGGQAPERSPSKRPTFNLFQGRATFDSPDLSSSDCFQDFALNRF